MNIRSRAVAFPHALSLLSFHFYSVNNSHCNYYVTNSTGGSLPKNGLIQFLFETVFVDEDHKDAFSGLLSEENSNWYMVSF